MKIGKEKLFGFLKGISRAGFIIVLCLAIFNLGVLFGTYSEEEETVMEFFTKETRYEWERTEDPPQTLVDQVEAYNKIHRLIWIALILSSLVMFFDYFVDPEHHFVTHIKKKWVPKFKKLQEEIEEENNV